MSKPTDQLEKFAAGVKRVTAQEFGRSFANPYEAGKHAGRFGPDNFNCHFGWFSSRESRDQWQRGYDETRNPKGKAS